jgi:hypothetical protein
MLKALANVSPKPLAQEQRITYQAIAARGVLNRLLQD